MRHRAINCTNISEKQVLIYGQKKYSKIWSFEYHSFILSCDDAIYTHNIKWIESNDEWRNI
jgi:hypothetical protein